MGACSLYEYKQKNFNNQLMKNYLIYGLGIATIILLFLYFTKPEIIETVTVTETVIEKVTDTIDNTKPTKIKKVYIKVPVQKTVHDTIEKRVEHLKFVYLDKEVNQYTYKDSLANGVLTSTILADSIYKRSIKLSTFNETTTTEITNTIVKPLLFIGLNASMTFDKKFDSGNINLYYVHKDKFLLNGGVGYNAIIEKETFNVGLALKF